MAFTQFPSRLFVRELDTSETLLMGGYTVSEPIAMTKAVLSIYKHGTAAGSESLRLKVFGAELTTSPAVATSNYSAIADIPGISTYWLGNLTFTFPTPVNLNPNNAAWFALEGLSYTRTDSFYLSYILDWPYPVSTQLTGGSASSALRIVGYQN